MPDQTGVPLGPPSPPPPPPPPAYRPPAPASPRGPRLGVVLVLVAALVLVVAAGVTGLVLALAGSDGAAPHARGPAPRGGPDNPLRTPTSGPATGLTTSTAASGSTEADRASAVSFAQSSLPTVLGYSADSYDEHVQAATALMTPAFAASYRRTASALRAVVVQQHTTLTPRVVETGLSGIDAGRADVLAFVDQTTRRSGAGEQLTRAWVSLSLVRSGTGWLISDLGTGTSPTATVTEPDPERRAAVDAARRVTTALLSLDYRHPGRSRDQVLALTTGTLAQRYRSSSASLAQSLARSRTVRTVQVEAAGVASFDASSAQVLLAATSQVTSVAGSPSQDDRILVTLTRVDGAWLASDLTFVS